MCKLVEDYAQEIAAEASARAAAEAAETAAKEEAAENALRMFQNGASLDFVSACIKRFSHEELLRIRSEALR